MSSINPQIDAAVALMKARAAECDETKTMEGMTALRLVGHANRNLRRVHTDLFDDDRHLGIPALDVDAARRDLLDTMNLCALALGLLPREGGE